HSDRPSHPQSGSLRPDHTVRRRSSCLPQCWQAHLPGGCMTGSFAPSLRLLAQVIGGLLGGPPPSAVLIGEPLVALARRHQVGAMLHGAVTAGHHAISAENFAALESDYAASRERRR